LLHFIGPRRGVKRQAGELFGALKKKLVRSWRENGGPLALLALL
jgi:hypothetical protein